ncbi:MAG: HD family phosphohydrolase [Bacillota bacterium]|nr:HD family phosphohydrolase [Bacillota bacterium]
MNLVNVLKSNRVKRIIIFLSIFVVAYGILLTSLIVGKKYNLKEGDIAKVDIKAPREVKDKMATDDKTKQASDSVDLQYSKSIEVKKNVLDDINNNFTQILKVKDSTIDDKLKPQNARSSVSTSISNDNLALIFGLNRDDIVSLQNAMVKTMSEVFNLDIREGHQEDIKKAQDTAVLQFNNIKLAKNITDIGVSIADNYIKPNFFFDDDKTKELRDEAAKKVQPVMIKKDQTVVKEGEPVTKEQIEILTDLGLLNNNSNFNWSLYGSLAAFVFIILFVQGYFLHKYEPEIYDDCSKLLLICILTAISLILSGTLRIISPFLIPISCAPMLLTLLISEKISLPISVLNCILISGTVEFNIEITLFAILSSILGSLILKKMQQRNDILYASLFIAIVNTISTFSVGVLLSNNMLEIFKKSGYSFIAGIISAILTIGLLPIFESAFDIVTTVKLLELSNPNNPLLKKLLIEATGTYHHSILVANLAEMAAEQVGGNPLLARVSAYFHDIGKLRRPYFFKENQIGGENPHDKITPNLSTLIITSHVKDGLELAKEYKLPKIIQDAIEQHHGTSLVKYFYITAKNSSEDPDEIKEENFRYPGPIPKSKEVAIIMLADGVEAAVRSIAEPTKGKVEEMVNNIIKDRLSEGQLDNCDLTLRDLEKIRKAFLKALSGIYHQRIEYPTDKWELREKNK